MEKSDADKHQDKLSNDVEGYLNCFVLRIDCWCSISLLYFDRGGARDPHLADHGSLQAQHF